MIFLLADLVLSPDGLTLCGAGESTKTFSVRSALIYHFLYSSILIFRRIDKAEVWFSIYPEGNEFIASCCVA